MLCPKCESSLSTGLTYCPACGYSLNPDELATLHEEALEDEEKAAESGSRHGVNWTLLLTLILILLCVYFTLDLYLTVRPAVTVQGHLSELRNERVTEAYYNYTSKDFQSTVSLNNFREFIRQHPVFTKQKDIQVDSENVDSNIGHLKGSLIDKDDSKTPIQYKLVKEQNVWKILNVYLNDKAMNSKTPLPEITKVIEDQLKYIRSNDLNNAYRYTTQEFQKETSMEEFRLFVRNYPALINNRGIELRLVDDKPNQAVIEGSLLADQGVIPIEYRLTKENDEWKIWGIKLQALPKVEKNLSFNNPSLLKIPVEKQLNAIRKNNLSKAYSEQSQAFKNHTPYEDFYAFIERLPFLRYQREKITDYSIGNGIATVVAEFQTEDGKITLEYSLGLENGLWKILRIQAIQDNPSTTEIAERPKLEKSQTDFFTTLAEGQLELLRKGEIRKVYQKYTAKVFRETISIDEFEQFINDHPVLRSYTSVEFQSPIVNKNMVVLKGLLISEDNSAVPIEFDLIKDHDEWKIIQIQLHEGHVSKSAA